jgi:bacillithiol system protein YtxJ
MKQKLKELTNMRDLEEAVRESDERPVLFFKHSLTCPVSSRALRELESYLEDANSQVNCKLIIVQRARDVSNEVAARLGVVHESPQALLVSRGREVWNTSHFSITSDSLREAIRSFSKPTGGE